MIVCTIDDAVTDWIIDYPETETVFRTLRIDCHCGGKSLEFACREAGHDVQRVLVILQDLIRSTGSDGE